MTYCFAWKTNNEVYIVADSLTSTKKSTNDHEADQSSLGEVYGKYNSYFVAETDIKIYRKENFIIAFSGDMRIYKEIKENLDLMVGHLTESEVINYLKGILGDAEIIMVIMQNDNNELRLLNKREDKIVTDFVSIGSGKDIPDLDNAMKNFSQTFPSFDDEKIDDIQRKKLSAATAHLQLVSIKNNFLEYGVGGTVCGICIYENKVEWNDDLLYFFYDQNFKNKKLINVLIRRNTILTGSDFTGLTKLFRLPEIDNELNEVDMRKIHRSMMKNISSHIPRYIVFYSIELNNIYFYDTHRRTQTKLVRMYQRRSNIDIKSDIFTNPYLVTNFLLKYNNEKDFTPNFHYLDGFPTEYLSRDQSIENTQNIEEIDFLGYERYDFPLENIQINIEIDGYFKKNLENYENLIIVNFDYLVCKILELRTFYKGLDVQFDSSDILKNLSTFLKREHELDEFEILVFSNSHQFFYKNIDGLELILTKNRSEFYLIANKLLHNYYTNQRYFHLNKIFIVDDSPYFNDLFEVFPEYNKEKLEADIFIIKNQSGDSEVLYEPYYYNADIILSKLSGLTDEALGLWSPREYSKEELEKIRVYLNKQIKSNRA